MKNLHVEFEELTIHVATNWREKNGGKACEDFPPYLHLHVSKLSTSLLRTVLFVMAKTGRRPSPFGNEKWNGRPAQTMWREGLWREVFRRKMAGAIPPIVLHSHTLTLIHTHIIIITIFISHVPTFNSTCTVQYNYNSIHCLIILSLPQYHLL